MTSIIDYITNNQMKFQLGAKSNDNWMSNKAVAGNQFDTQMGSFGFYWWILE